MAENKKQEFLRELGEKLSEGLGEQEIMSQLQYYAGYIDGEMARGKTMDEAVEDLGEPILIARTILEAPREEDLFFGRAVQSQSDAYAEGNYQGENQISTDEIRAAVRADVPLGEAIPPEVEEEIKEEREEEERQEEERRQEAGGQQAKRPEESRAEATRAEAPTKKPQERPTGQEEPEMEIHKGEPVKTGLFRDGNGHFRWDLFAVILTAALFFAGVLYLAVKVLSALGPVLVAVLAAAVVIYLIIRKKS